MRFCILVSAACALTSLVVADPLWVATYNGPYDDYDEVHAIGVDDSGNVIVSGRSGLSEDDDEFVTIKFRPDGSTAWLRHFNPGSGLDGATALAVDQAGNVTVTGYQGGSTSQYGDWATIRYSAGGESLWAAIKDFGDEDGAAGIAADAAGNSYVTGRAGWQNDLDFEVVKYDPAGNEAWVFNYNGGYDDLSRALAVDGQGNTYVTGQTEPGAGDLALMTWKLGLGGESLWANVYAGPAGSYLRGLAVAADSQGNAVVAGLSSDTLTYDDYLTVKYGPTGETVWTRRYNGPGNRSDQVMGLALDADGNTYVTGTSDVDAQGHYNYATVKYSPAGEQRWVARYAGPRHYDRACGLALDADANVYVVGSSVNSSGDWDVVTLKYDSAGNQLWVERFDMPSTFDEAYVAALSQQGTIFAGGRTRGDTTGMDYLTLAYGAAGAVADERTASDTRGSTPSASIVRGVLLLPPSLLSLPSSLLSIDGRKVLDLKPGPNDVRLLSPGVYFMRMEPSAAGGRQSSVRKVLVAE